MAEIDDAREGSDRRAGCTGRGESLFVPCLSWLRAKSHTSHAMPRHVKLYRVHHRIPSKPPVWSVSQDMVITKTYIASPCAEDHHGIATEMRNTFAKNLSLTEEIPIGGHLGG